jgi:hypothetical protein
MAAEKLFRSREAFDVIPTDYSGWLSQDVGALEH